MTIRMNERQTRNSWELVKDITFLIEGISVENRRTSVHTGEARIGEKLSSDETGFVTKYIFDVATIPRGQRCGIKRLVFYGANTVRSGDSIEAKVPIGYRENDPEGGFLYYERKESDEEEAIQLLVLGRNEAAESVNYEEFTKPKR